MYLQQISEPNLAHNAYLIGCPESGDAIIIDPQRDIERYVTAARQAGLRIIAAAETHIHADYLTGLREFAHKHGAHLMVSDEGDQNWKYDWVTRGDYSATLLKHGSKFSVGTVQFEVLHTPGHTPEHIAFLVTDLRRDQAHPLGMISGDFIFVGDVGRPDLLETAAGELGTMESSARTLYDSIQSFKTLNPSLVLWPGHASGSLCGRALSRVPVSSVGYEVSTNPAIRAASERESFVSYILAGQPEPPPYFARMKKENREGPALLDDAPQLRKTTAEEILQLTQDTAQPQWLDLRPWKAYADSHLPGAIFAESNAMLVSVLGSYVTVGRPLGLIVDHDNLEDVCTACIRIGLDNITHWMPPEEYARYRALGGPTTELRDISMVDLMRVQVENGATLLDVRGAAELLETGMIDQSVTIPHTQLLSRHKELERDRTIYVYCRTGNRSRFAAGVLQSLGFDVIHVDGGFDAWLLLNGPVVAPVAVDRRAQPSSET